MISISPGGGLPKVSSPGKKQKSKNQGDPGKILLDSLVSVQVHREDGEEKVTLQNSDAKIEQVKSAVPDSPPTRVFTFEEKVKMDIERYEKLCTDEFNAKLASIEELTKNSEPPANSFKTFFLL